MAKGETIHLRIEESLRDRLVTLAAKDHRSLSNLIEKIVLDWYEDKHQKPRARTINGHDTQAAKTAAP